MLVLTRKKYEKIKIGNDIEITVVSIKGKQVRIGVDAPLSLLVIRAEVGNVMESNHGTFKALLAEACALLGCSCGDNQTCKKCEFMQKAKNNMREAS